MTRSSRLTSARVRILGAILAVASIGLAIAGSVTFLIQRENVLSEVDGRLHSQVAGLRASPATDVPDADDDRGGAATVTENLDIDDFASIDEFLTAAVARLLPGRNEASVGIVDGEARFRPETPPGFDVAANDEFIDQVVARAASGAFRGTVTTDEGTLKYISVPVRMAGDERVGLYVRAVDLDQELAGVATAATTYWIAAVAVIIAIAAVGWFVTGRLITPIRHLREAADAITITDLSPRLPAEGNDEIADLSRTVNSMLDRLEGSVDVQRQLLDDVRHELKTPITIVRGHLEMMDAADATDVEATREIGIAELDRMTRLVDDIDLLATVEGGDQFQMADVDVAALTERVGELVTAIPGHVWRVENTGTGRIRGDADRLVQAWLQLADNAAKYTPAGSPIEIGSTLDAAGGLLWVRDHGTGIPPSARHRIFRRFHRGVGTRAAGGSGLGLAIVDAITKAHAGRCVVTDTPGGGATFTIQLPLPTEGLPAPVRAGDVVLQREAAG